MDFTLNQYIKLLESLQTAGFFFQTFKEYLEQLLTESNQNLSYASKIFYQRRTVVLRHDVDDLKFNSLRFAKIQSAYGVFGSYYFRAVPQSWDEEVIAEIHELGHEVGYHYECLTTCNGNKEAAIYDFASNLEKLRMIAPVTTICMHGSPQSKYDSKDLWHHHDYRDFGIIGEPYFDIDFKKVFYLTDTGRRWDGWRVSLRDKVPQQEEWVRKGLVFHSTQDIINAIKEDRLPYPLMMKFHPQRWTDKPIPWLKEWVTQGVKNEVKRAKIKHEKRGTREER